MMVLTSLSTAGPSPPMLRFRMAARPLMVAASLCTVGPCPPMLRLRMAARPLTVATSLRTGGPNPPMSCLRYPTLRCPRLRPRPPRNISTDTAAPTSNRPRRRSTPTRPHRRTTQRPTRRRSRGRLRHPTTRRFPDPATMSHRRSGRWCEPGTSFPGHGITTVTEDPFFSLALPIPALLLLWHPAPFEDEHFLRLLPFFSYLDARTQHAIFVISDGKKENGLEFFGKSEQTRPTNKFQRQRCGVSVPFTEGVTSHELGGILEGVLDLR